MCTDNADAKAELQSMINAEAEATRYAMERRKRNDNEDGRLESLNEDSAGMVQICSNESLVATSSLPRGERVSASFDSGKLTSPRGIAALDKEDHKKKKKFPLSSISMFVGKMKSHRISGGVAKQEVG